MANTTITDTPRRGATEQDRFGIIAYERGLEAFLRGASTPITIALQGEWGSGKTSLMNVLRDELCGTGNNTLATLWTDFYSGVKRCNDVIKYCGWLSEMLLPPTQKSSPKISASMLSAL